MLKTHADLLYHVVYDSIVNNACHCGFCSQRRRAAEEGPESLMKDMGYPDGSVNSFRLFLLHYRVDYDGKEMG